MFLTGLYLVGQGFTTDALLATTRGTLVLAVVGLWLLLSALTNASSGR